MKKRNLTLIEIDEAFQTGLSGGSPIGLAGCGIWRFFAVIFGIFELKTGAGSGNFNHEREWDFVFLWGWDAGFARGTEWDMGFQFLRDHINCY